MGNPAILHLTSSIVAAAITGIAVGGVGDITGPGTVGLVLFVGLAAGLTTGVLLFALRTVLPAGPSRSGSRSWCWDWAARR